MIQDGRPPGLWSDYSPARPGPNARLTVWWDDCELTSAPVAPRQDDELATLLAPSAPVAPPGFFLSTPVFLVNHRDADIFVQFFAVATAQEPPFFVETRCGPPNPAPPTPVHAGTRHLVGLASLVLPDIQTVGNATVTVVWKEGPLGRSDQLIARSASFEVTAQTDGAVCTTTVTKI